MLLPDECLELSGQYQVAQVLPRYEHPVLVIDDLFGLAPEIRECQLVRIHRQLRVEGPAAEMHKLVA